MPEPIFTLLRAAGPGSLTAEESAELAARVADLAKTGLPLESGLRALADEVPSRRLAGVLRRLATRLSAGMALETAIEAEGTRLPAHLRGLIVAGLRSGRLVDALDEYADLARRQRDLGRRAVLSLAYPALLTALVALLLLYFHLCVVGEFRQIFKDFGTQLPALTEIILYLPWSLSLVVGAVAVLLCVLPWLPAVVPAGQQTSRLLLLIPVVGPILRWSGLARLAHLLAMLLEREVPLPEALRLAAAGSGHIGAIVECEAVAADIEEGQPLDEAMAAQGRFPPSITTLVEWGQRRGALPDVLRAAAEMYESWAQTQATLLDAVLLPFAFLGLTAMAGIMFLGLMLPFIALVSNLSGGMGPSRGSSGHGPADSLLLPLLALPLLGIGLTVVIRFLAEPFLDKSRSVTQVTLGFAFRLQICLAVGATFVASGFSVLWFLALVVVFSMLQYRFDAARRVALLALLAAAAERSLPLAPVIDAFGRERRGPAGRRAQRIAMLLRQGRPLPEAVTAVPRVLPRQALPLVRLGEETGSLPKALRQAVAAYNLGQSVW